MSLRTRTTASLLMMGAAFASCATPPGDHNHDQGHVDLKRVTNANRSASNEGKSFVKDVSMKVPVDLVQYVLGDELINRTSDTEIRPYPELFIKYVEANGWDLDDERLKRAADQYIQIYTAQEKALRDLEDSGNPIQESDAAKARLQIEKIREMMVDAPSEALETHEHNPIDGKGRNHDETRDHVHAMPGSPGEIDRTIGTHPDHPVKKGPFRAAAPEVPQP